MFIFPGHRFWPLTRLGDCSAQNGDLSSDIMEVDLLDIARYSPMVFMISPDKSPYIMRLDI